MLSIGMFSKISNVTAKALRYYDEIGLIRPARVNGENGYRYYDVSQLNDILLINRLRSYSFSLDEIAGVMRSPGDDMLLFRMMREKRREVRDRRDSYNYILRQLEKDLLNLERGIHIMAYLDNIEIKLVDTGPRNILSIRKKMSTDDYGKYMGQLFETVAREKLTVTGGPMSIYHDEEFDPLSNDTEIAIPVKDAVKGTRTMAGGLCAMGTLKGPYSELTSLYAKLEQWVDDGGYTVATSPYEIYINDPRSGISPEEFLTEVYFPVKK